MAKNSKKVEIKTFQDLKNLSKRRVFGSWNKKHARYNLADDVPTKEIIKALRYVHKDFDNYDLRKFKDNPQTRAKAARYLNQYYEFKERENAREFVPHKNNRKLIAELSQQSTKWKKFYIPSDAADFKITYKKVNGKKRAIEKTKVATYINVYFDQAALAENPEKEIDRSLEGIKNIELLKLHAAENLVGGMYGDKQQLLMDVELFMTKYDNYQEWMTGVKVLHSFNKRK